MTGKETAACGRIARVRPLLAEARREVRRWSYIERSGSTEATVLQVDRVGDEEWAGAEALLASLGLDGTGPDPMPVGAAARAVVPVGSAAP